MSAPKKRRVRGRELIKLFNEVTSSPLTIEGSLFRNDFQQYSELEMIWDFGENCPIFENQTSPISPTTPVNSEEYLYSSCSSNEANDQQQIMKFKSFVQSPL